MKSLVIGGCGFIGSNLAYSQMKEGHDVIVFDNLSRKGTEINLQWLKASGNNMKFVKGDVRDFEALKKCMLDVDHVFHLAAQVAVTTSITDPVLDFDINARGTFNVLEAIRSSNGNPTLVTTSTNKVYGGLDDLKVEIKDEHYSLADLDAGVDESRPLDFHSPYGCSKGAADQYVRDYARIYSLRNVVFRMSCIYGPRQFGNEDQGWLAHFIISHLLNKNITIFGDGKQVRDILFVEDLLLAFKKAIANIQVTKGQIYNMGGGPQNVISLLDLIAYLEKLTGHRQSVKYEEWREGDQKVYVSNVSKAKKDFSWEPTISKYEGISRLYEWAKANSNIFTNRNTLTA